MDTCNKYAFDILTGKMKFVLGITEGKQYWVSK